MPDYSNDIFEGLDQNSGFTEPTPAKNEEPTMPTIIKVVGVGGGGSNAINHMYAQNIGGVSFVVINTDRQALITSPVPNRLLIGPETTKGLGAGNKPEVARAAAEESADDISKLFDDDTKMVFITAGMGGGTGTGAAPIVAKIARDKGILTIGIVTIPFLFEGQKKIIKALNGAEEMQKFVDALLVINNERLTEIYPGLDLDNGFGMADETLSVAARSISELITVQGKINLDFNDVNTTLRDGGVAIISSGYGEGEKRVTKAIEDALNSPLLKNRDVYGSKTILVNIYYSRKANQPFLMSEVNEMTQFMTNFAPEVDVIWGVAFDETLEDKVRITILAAGFNMSLDGDAPAPVVSKPKQTSSTLGDQERLRQEYGTKVDDANLQKAEARYFLMRPEDFDNDDIINEMECKPVFDRDNQFKPRMAELQSASPAKLREETPKDDSAKKSQPGTTISFG